MAFFALPKTSPESLDTFIVNTERIQYISVYDGTDKEQSIKIFLANDNQPIVYNFVNQEQEYEKLLAELLLALNAKPLPDKDGFKAEVW
ncbi:hypothetical protein [Hymenobacter nivis]|uniref:Uncharacterized protein n=1 Tax=Hymenobacter nivis TaxID=1850093 RepID=A0A502GXH2_9BACT|nr:hypothetical protein [Hymenobacter nivis]TPG66068.1 hypothetical protein EAH73_11910 [Hymenobacter nivis]